MNLDTFSKAGEHKVFDGAVLSRRLNDYEI